MKNFLKKIFPFLFKEDKKVKGHRPPDDDEREYTFVWYKKMEVGNKTQYTSPNRTKIRANNREEAVKKMTDFAMRKMVLVIHEEKEYESSDINKLNEEFNKLNDEMNRFFNSINRHKR